tara:strand:+ start:104 stop:373 length:270 start_codon:yes stop_codon:yes gene_type:complete
MNEQEVRAKCVQLAEMAGGLTVEVKGLVKENEILKDYIDNIAAIIHYQMPLKEQDAWLKSMIKEGYYTVDPEDGCSKLYSMCMCMECLG